MEFFVSNAGTVERVWVGGKLWLVANLTMIVPGVLNGSKGALYYPVEECKVSVPRWDGTPIVVRHPSDPITNEPLPADAPGVWQRQGIGVVRSPRFDGKLRAKGWFDAERTERVSPEVHDALVNGRSIELSTGLFTDNHPSPGVDDRGRPYDFVARNYRADHLAILPDQVGACSVRDGCGVLVNAEAGGGRWVTTEGGQHLFLSDEGFLHVSPGGKRVGSDNFVAVVDGKGKVSGREMLRHNLGGKDQSGEMDAAFSQKTEDKFRRAEPEEVDVSSLIATQDKVYKAGLRKKADDDAPVKVARVGGKLLIVDGTHRVVKAMRGGRKSIMAKVVDGEPDRVSNFFSLQEPVMAKSLLERFINLFSSNAEPARSKDGTFGASGPNTLDDPNAPGDDDGPIDPMTGEPVFKKGKGSTKNANPEGHNQYTGGGGSKKSVEPWDLGHEAGTRKAIDHVKEHGTIDPIKGKPGMDDYDMGHMRGWNTVHKRHSSGEDVTKNAGRCSRCGGEMDEDGECEDCGHVENAGRHLETGQYLPDGAPSGKQVGSAVKKGHGTVAIAKKPAPDLDGDGDSDGPSTARNPGNREPMADVDDHDPKNISNKRTINVKITTKSQALKVLTSNCRCEADRAAFNNLSEETLLRLANNDGGSAAADGGKSGKSVQAGGQEDDVQDIDESDDTPGGDLPSVRAKGGKTVNQWMAEAPPEVQSVVANAIKVEKAEKRRVASLLVANVGSEERRKARFKHYMAMALPDLVEVLRDRGQVRNFGPGPSQDADEELNLNFLGAAGGMTTDNSSDLGEADILPLPVSNWAEASKQA